MKALLIAGSTGVGKSQIAYNLAKTLGSSVITADSVQIYKYFNIGANKPSDKMIQKVDYKMLNRYDPAQEVTGWDFAIEAREHIRNLFEQGKVPVIEGGSWLYLKFLLFGGGYGDKQLLQEHKDKAQQIIKPYRGDWLQAVQVAQQAVGEFEIDFGSNDFTRLEKQIALKLAGITEVSFQEKPQFPVEFHYIDTPMQTLQRLLDYRCEKMVQNGLVEETIELIADGRIKNVQRNPHNSIGYKESIDYLKQIWNIAADNGPGFSKVKYQFSVFLDQFQNNTRKFAKKQRKNFTNPLFQFQLHNTFIDSLGQLPNDKLIPNILNSTNYNPQMLQKRTDAEKLEMPYQPYRLIFQHLNRVLTIQTERTIRSHIKQIKAHRDSLSTFFN